MNSAGDTRASRAGHEVVGHRRGPAVTESRARMSAFLAASRPDRSSRGSGSAYPRSTASRTASENRRPADTADVMNISVPLTQPSIRSTRSPVSTSF